MTPQQQTLFLSAARMGWAMGCAHPYEWLTNWQMHVLPLERMDLWTQANADMVAAFVAFFQGAASAPDDPVLNLTPDGLLAQIEAWYGRQRPMSVEED